MVTATGIGWVVKLDEFRYMHSDYKIRSTIYNESGVHTGVWHTKEEATEFFSQFVPVKDVPAGNYFFYEGKRLRKVGFNDQFELINTGNRKT